MVCSSFIIYIKERGSAHCLSFSFWKIQLVQTVWDVIPCRSPIWQNVKHSPIWKNVKHRFFRKTFWGKSQYGVYLYAYKQNINPSMHGVISAYSTIVNQFPDFAYFSIIYFHFERRVFCLKLKN